MRNSIGSKLTVIISLVFVIMFVGKGTYDGVTDYTRSIIEIIRNQNDSLAHDLEAIFAEVSQSARDMVALI